jgi:hypothetical protein
MVTNMVSRYAALAVALESMFFGAHSAVATIPRLTDGPNPSSITACKQWAAQQSGDAIDMWGIQEDGSSSRTVSLDRLARHCVGEPAPEIVGFGSSAGFNETYCKKFPTIKLCKQQGAAEGSKPASCVVFHDNGQVTVRGTIMESKNNQPEGGGRLKKFRAIILETQICFDQDLEEKLAFVAVSPVSVRWLGHHVFVTGAITATGEGWFIDVSSIKDVKR